MRAALFARYSSKMQDELSLDAQLAEMEAYCTARSWTVTHRFLLPETRSADIERAPEFQDMMATAKRKGFDVLLVHKLDRFGRDRETSIVHKAALRRLNIQVRSVVENLGDSIMERAMEGMIEVMAEWYAQNLGQETKKGHRQLVRNGCWTGGKVPWGLAVEETQDGHKRLVVDPVKGPVMARVFERLAAGDRTGDILDEVRRRSGEAWSKPTYYTRVRNPIYHGLIEYGETTMPGRRKRAKTDPTEVIRGEWAGLVSRDTWEAANRVLNERGAKATHNRRPAAFYLLSDGLLSCAACGSPIIGGYLSGERKYACSARQRGCPAGYAAIRADEMEPQTLQHAKWRLETLDLGEAIQFYEQSLKPELEAATAKALAIRRRGREVERQINNLIDAVANGLPAQEAAGKIKLLRAESNQLAEEMVIVEHDAWAAVRLNVDVVREHVLHVRQLLDEELEQEDLKTILQTFFRGEVDLKGRGAQLLFRLDPSESPARLRFGRSARTKPKSRFRLGQTRPVGPGIWHRLGSKFRILRAAS